MIFPYLEIETKAQVDDRTRLDAGKTYITPDEEPITVIEIQPEAAASFYDVTNDKFLDWQYSTDGVKTVTVRVTTDGAPVTTSKTLTVVTAANDALLSSDADLTAHESDILKWVRPGRNSYLDKHRAAQQRIMAYLDEQGIKDVDGERLTLAALIDKEEFREWSKFETLSIIFNDLKNAVDDVFGEKKRIYEGLRDVARNRASVSLDRDGDDVKDATVGIRTLRIFR